MSARGRSDVSRTVTKVYVGGLIEDIGNDQLQNEFERFGPIKSVWVARNPSSKGYAFVDFYEVDHALDAVKEMDGQFCFGARIKVQISKNELDKSSANNSSTSRRSEERYERYESSRRHHRSESPKSDSYESRRSPLRRSSNRSPETKRKRNSRSPDSTKQNTAKSFDPAQLVDPSVLRDSLLRNALSLLLLRDPLLVNASSALGLAGLSSRNGDTDNAHNRSRSDLFSSLNIPDTLAQQAALQTMLLNQSVQSGNTAGTSFEEGLSLHAPAPNLLPNQPSLFPVENHPSKSTTPSVTSAPTETSSDWYVNRYYGYHLQPPVFSAASSSFASGINTPASAHQAPPLPPTPTFPMSTRMPFPNAPPRPPRMQPQSVPAPPCPPAASWRSQPPNTSS